MLNNHFAEQSVTVNFTSLQVKNAIKEILAKKTTKYPSKQDNLNDVMGTYQFFELGINSLQININIKEIEAEKTEINFRVVPDSTSRADSSACSNSITNFQKLLTGVLTGAGIPESKGCAGVVVLFIGLSIMFLIS
jgi:hypothetical protein